MVRRFMEHAKRQWGKITGSPLPTVRLYPPPFILRNPVLKGVTAAFQSGYETAVVIFNLPNSNELAIKLGRPQYARLRKAVKKYFRIAVHKELNQQDVISLHDFYGDGLTLFIRVHDNPSCFSDVDAVTKKIIQHVESRMDKLYPSMELQFETGYMFIDKHHYSLEDAIVNAHRNAVAIAEKRIKSDYSSMIHMVKKLIRQKDIKLLAQPIIDVATKEVRAWEILTRGPVGTALESPLQLFSVARQTGKLYELEMIVIEKALEQIKLTKCRQDVFINCTPLTLSNIRFTHDVKTILEKFKGISPAKITIEVTENDSIDGLKHFIYNIKKLRLMGFRIAVDDTGAGYSSLHTISEILPDIIKIDSSVIKNIDKNTLKESMLQGLLLVAREAGSLVVAEGIENEAEASVLVRNKVDLAQGYFYARPMTMVNNIAT